MSPVVTPQKTRSQRVDAAVAEGLEVADMICNLLNAGFYEPHNEPPQPSKLDDSNDANRVNDNNNPRSRLLERMAQRRTGTKASPTKREVSLFRNLCAW